MTEEWRKIVGFGDCYSVSNLGRIMRTSPRNIPWRGRTQRQSRAKPFTPSEVKSFPNRGGYLQVRIGPAGAQKTVSVHRLVAIAFVSNPNGSREVNHKDGVKTHNAPENLEWSSRCENMRHAIKTGLQEVHRGQNHPNAKLTAIAVAAIRSDPRVLRLIAKDHGVHLSLISLVKRRKVWAHVCA